MPVAATVTGPAGEDLEKFLINFVVEQTGYPPEVVELDADLEADLGIDSIKKAQLFGELREYFDVTPGENLTLDDFPTLRHVLNYLQGAPAKGDSSVTAAAVDNVPLDSPPQAASGVAELAVDDFPRAICLAGSPRQMGLSMASRPGRESRRSSAAMRTSLGQHSTHWPPAAASRIIPKRCSREELDELEGLADAVDAPLGNLVAHNVALFADLGDECLQFAMSGSGEALVHGWHGRVPIAAALGECLRPMVQVRRPVEGIPYALVSFVGAVGALGGMNAAGVAITCFPTATGRGRSGSRAHAALARVVLQEAEDLEAAVAILDRCQAEGNWSACLSHAATGQMCCVRCNGTSLEVRQSTHGLVVETIPETFAAGVRAELPAISARSLGPMAFREAIERVWSDGNAPAENGHGTTLSLILDAQRREIWVRQGNAKAPADFTHVSLARMFEPSSPNASRLQWREGEREQELQLHGRRTGPAEVSHAEAEEELFQEELHTQRFVMRMVDAPLKSDGPTSPVLSGPALVLGQNPAAEAMRQLLGSQGVQVHNLAIGEDVDAVLAQLEHLWQQGPIPHVFLMSGRDSNAGDASAGDLGDPAVWAEHRRRDVIVPYFLCQRWLQLAGDAKLLDRCTLVTATALGGDLGFSGCVRWPGSGGLAGLTKAIWMEYVILRKLKSMVVKIVDPPDDEPADALAANILREMAAQTLDYEAAFVGGRRRLQNAVYQAAEVQPRARIRPGAVWVATGGARGHHSRLGPGTRPPLRAPPALDRHVGPLRNRSLLARSLRRRTEIAPGHDHAASPAVRPVGPARLAACGEGLGDGPLAYGHGGRGGSGHVSSLRRFRRRGPRRRARRDPPERRPDRRHPPRRRHRPRRRFEKKKREDVLATIELEGRRGLPPDAAHPERSRGLVHRLRLGQWAAGLQRPDRLRLGQRHALQADQLVSHPAARVPRDRLPLASLGRLRDGLEARGPGGLDWPGAPAPMSRPRACGTWCGNCTPTVRGARSSSPIGITTSDSTGQGRTKNIPTTCNNRRLRWQSPLRKSPEWRGVSCSGRSRRRCRRARRPCHASKAPRTSWATIPRRWP